jgi:hypothetical protein
MEKEILRTAVNRSNEWRSRDIFYTVRLPCKVMYLILLQLIGKGYGFTPSAVWNIGSSRNACWRLAPVPPWMGCDATSWAARNYRLLVPICSTSNRAEEVSIDTRTATESTATSSAFDQEGLEKVSLQDFLSNAELTVAETSSFSDDDIYEEMEDQEDNNDYDSNDPSTTQRQIPSYLRDEEEMLTEREDRLYAAISNRQRTVEACILVGVDDISEERLQHRTGGTTTTIFTMEESMKEMRELIKTAGMELKGEITQRLQEPNPRTYVGTGKLAETQEMAKLRDACTIVFDAELTPGQQKSLENAFNKNILQNDFLGSEGVRSYHKRKKRTCLVDFTNQPICHYLYYSHVLYVCACVCFFFTPS